MTGRRLAAVPLAPRRAVALVRVSKVGDRGEDLVSPELQRNAINDYAAGRNITVTMWVEALDESASQAKSPWWARLDDAISVVERGEADLLLVYKLSRAARHRRRWAIAVDRVEVAGGAVESATEGWDAATSTGRLTRGLLSELAAWEAEVRSDQWKEAHERRRRHGLPAGGGTRFGYTYSRADGYRPDPRLGQVLASMYADYVAGKGVMYIASRLNALDVTTLRGSKWVAGGVFRQLDSGFGAGMIRAAAAAGKGELVRGAHEPVIDEAVWAAYQRRRADMRQSGRADVAPRHVLTGLLRCGRCGGSMSAYGQPGRGGEPVRMFRCVTWQANRTCRGAWVRAARAEAVVLEWLGEVAGEAQARAATTAARHAAAAVANADRTRLERELVRADASLERLTVGFATGDVPASAYGGARDQLVAQREAVLAELAKVERDAAALSEPLGPVARDLLGSWELLRVARKHALLGLLLERVEVRPGSGQGAQVVPVPRWQEI